jgi:nicotinamidase-related amidase
MPLTTVDERVALVVVDLQNGALGRPMAPYTAQDVVDRTARLAEAFRERGLPVVLTRFTVAAEPRPRRTDVTGAPRPAPPAGWDAVVDGLTGDVVITKYGWDSFHDTDLDEQLRQRGVTQLVLTGVATSIGVESTARAAYERGYHLTFATDAIADLDPAAHDHTVRRILPVIGETGATADIIALVRDTHA